MDKTKQDADLLKQTIDTQNKEHAQKVQDLTKTLETAQTQGKEEQEKVAKALDEEKQLHNQKLEELTLQLTYVLAQAKQLDEELTKQKNLVSEKQELWNINQSVE